MSTEPEVILDHVEPGIARITLNRPAQRNAVNKAARRRLLEAFDECRRHDVRAVIITGAGSAFCAGVDLKELASGDEENWNPVTSADRHLSWRALQEEIRSHPAIFISSVNGFALAGGLTLINSSDLAIAAEDAMMGMPEMGFGSYASLAGPSTQLRVNQKRAAYLVLTTRRVDGRTAEAWGLVNSAVPREELVERTLDLARDVARFDGDALAAAKQALWHIPMRIPEWSGALSYGEEVVANLRARADSTDRGLAQFAAGGRSAGQGTG